MTQISNHDVQYLAQLSNLQLTAGEVTDLQQDLERILGYVDQLSELDTSGVNPTYQVTDLENVWREDTINNYGLDKEELLSLAPERVGNQIKVPKVL